MEGEEKTTVSTSYVFRGIEYIVTMSTTGGSSLAVEVEDRLTADQWRATFDSACMSFEFRYIVQTLSYTTIKVSEASYNTKKNGHIC